MSASASARFRAAVLELHKKHPELSNPDVNKLGIARNAELFIAASEAAGTPASTILSTLKAARRRAAQLAV